MKTKVRVIKSLQKGSQYATKTDTESVSTSAFSEMEGEEARVF